MKILKKNFNLDYFIYQKYNKKIFQIKKIILKINKKKLLFFKSLNQIKIHFFSNERNKRYCQVGILNES